MQKLFLLLTLSLVLFSYLCHAEFSFHHDFDNTNSQGSRHLLGWADGDSYEEKIKIPGDRRALNGDKINNSFCAFNFTSEECNWRDYGLWLGALSFVFVFLALIVLLGALIFWLGRTACCTFCCVGNNGVFGGCAPSDGICSTNVYDFQGYSRLSFWIAIIAVFICCLLVIGGSLVGIAGANNLHNGSEDTLNRTTDTMNTAIFNLTYVVDTLRTLNSTEFSVPDYDTIVEWRDKLLDVNDTYNDHKPTIKAVGDGVAYALAVGFALCIIGAILSIIFLILRWSKGFYIIPICSIFLIPAMWILAGLSLALVAGTNDACHEVWNYRHNTSDSVITYVTPECGPLVAAIQPMLDEMKQTQVIVETAYDSFCQTLNITDCPPFQELLDDIDAIPYLEFEVPMYGGNVSLTSCATKCTDNASRGYAETFLDYYGNYSQLYKAYLYFLPLANCVWPGVLLENNTEPVCTQMLDGARQTFGAFVIVAIATTFLAVASIFAIKRTPSTNLKCTKTMKV